jgi:triosephosphate isomerase
MRTPIIAGNWKMNKTVSEAVLLATELKDAAKDVTGVEIVLCPTYTALYAVNQVISGSNVELAAQDVFFKLSGAYTSQISPLMLTDVGCKYTIIGHSETRGRFGVP